VVDLTKGRGGQLNIEANPEESAAALRPVHYLGNKSRFLTRIETAVADVSTPDSLALDLFSGSGVVARKLAESRPVIAADVQCYSSILVSALTAPNPPANLDPILSSVERRFDSLPSSVLDLMFFEETALRNQDAGTLANIVECGSIAAGIQPSAKAFSELKERARLDLFGHGELTLFRHYGGVYFSYRQALELDAIATAINSLPEVERNTALAALLGTASDAVSTVGSHFAQPLRPKDSKGQLKISFVRTLTKARQLSAQDLFSGWVNKYGLLKPSPYPCSAVMDDFRNVLSAVGESAGVIYADPPYTRDHYSRFYHVLETIALGDEPGVSITKVGSESVASRGLYRVARHQSPFSIRSQVVDAFSLLFAHCGEFGTPLVLSYSPSTLGTIARPQTRMMTVSQLLDLAKHYFRNVSILSTDHLAHSKFNRQELNAGVDYDAEILILGTH